MENIQFEEVPNIITGKDLDYLSDIFQWNYEALKKMDVAKNQIQEPKLKSLIEKGYNIFNNNLNITLSILQEGGANE